MTKESTEIVAIGFVAVVLALVSLGTVDTGQRSESQTGATHSAPIDETKRSASNRTLQALRRGQSIDINRATAADLELLPGIGPILAQRIIVDRIQNGFYQNVKDLTRVNGIGPVTLTRIMHLLTVECSKQIQSDNKNK